MAYAVWLQPRRDRTAVLSRLSMLWRASQIFGRFRLAAFQLTARGDIFIPILHLQTALRVRCMSAALALQARAIFATPIVRQEDKQRRTGKNARSTKFDTNQPVKKDASKPPIHPMRYLPQPRWDLVKMVDTLFKRRRSGDCTREELRSYWTNPEAVSHLEDPNKARELAVLMVNTGVPRRACRVLLLAHTFGCSFKQNVYEAVAYQLYQTQQWAEIPTLVALGRRQTGRSTGRLLNFRARALVEISHYGLLNRVLDDFKEENIAPNRKTYHALVSGNLRNRDIAKVKECLGWMEEAGFPMDASTHALLVSNYRSIGSNPAVQEQAMESLPDLGPRSATAVINSLIQLSLDTRDIKSALKFLSFFDKPTWDTKVIDRRREDALEDRSDRAAIRDPRAYPTLSPDIATFTMLINYAARMRSLSLAQQMIHRVHHFSIPPDAIYVTALVRVFCSVKDYHTALSVVATTCKDVLGALPLLHALGLDVTDTGRPELVPPGITLTQRMANALLAGMLERNGFGALRPMWKLMQLTGLKFDGETLEVLMSYIASRGYARPRELKTALQMFPGHFVPTQRHVHILLRAIVGRQRALAFPDGGWNTIIASPPTQSASSRACLDPPHLSSDESLAPETLEEIAASILRGKQRLRNITQRLVSSLTSRRETADKATVQIGMLHQAVVIRNIERAKQTLRSMLDRGISPNEYHYAALMEGHCLSGETHSAEKILWRAREEGYGKDPVLFTILIHGYARMHQPTEATRIFQEMLAARVEPDIGSIDALASSYYAIRAFSAARRVLLQSWPKFAPFPPELKTANLKTLLENFRKLSDQTTLLSPQARRMLRFNLKRIRQNFRSKRQKPKRRKTRQRGANDVVQNAEMTTGRGGEVEGDRGRDVLAGTSGNKYTTLQ